MKSGVNIRRWALGMAGASYHTKHKAKRPNAKGPAELTCRLPMACHSLRSSVIWINPPSVPQSACFHGHACCVAAKEPSRRLRLSAHHNSALCDASASQMTPLLARESKGQD